MRETCTIWRASQSQIVDMNLFMAISAIADLVRRLLEKHQPRAIVHFAAESHVDRSIRGPDDFIRTNVDGTFALLEEVRAYWSALPENERKRFASCMFPPMKFTDRSVRTIRLSPRPRLCAEQSLFRVEGGVRSPGAGLSPHLRTADAHDELLE